MTMSTTTKDTGLLPGDSSTFSFSFSPMVIYAASELEVYLVVIATGVETLLVEGTGATTYSVPAIDATNGTTGAITYPADQVTPIATTSAVLIKRKLAQTQATVFNNQGGYFPKTLERQFDKYAMMIQALQEEVDRCLKLPITAPATFASTEIAPDALLTASTYVRINSGATGFDVAGISAGTTATASDAAPIDVNVSSASAGAGTDFSRQDHRHYLPTTVPRLATANVWTETQTLKKNPVVCAAALDLAAVAGNIFDITTGVNTVTSIPTMGAGTVVILQVDIAVTFTHHATNLVLPGGQSIVTKIGDVLMLYEYATADWRLISHMHGPTNTNGRLPAPDYESAETSLNNDAQITFAHGLTNLPSLVTLTLRANTATAQGFADNEESAFPLTWHGIADDDLLSVTWDATNIYVTTGLAIQLVDHVSFNSEAITQSEYDWVVRAWK